MKSKLRSGLGLLICLLAILTVVTACGGGQDETQKAGVLRCGTLELIATSREGGITKERANDFAEEAVRMHGLLRNERPTAIVGGMVTIGQARQCFAAMEPEMAAPEFTQGWGPDDAPVWLVVMRGEFHEPQGPAGSKPTGRPPKVVAVVLDPDSGRLKTLLATPNVE